MKRIIQSVVLASLLACGSASASDAEEILGLLNNFLANAGVESAHERFWADDLVYTSSRGTRTTKAGIMASFEGAEEEGEDEPGPVYSADEVQLKSYGDTMIVAFKLVATPPNDSPVDYYFNTGTFLKRDGEWRVVAWQATKIPPPENPDDS
jgi:ketosteroid isomerase-like protein